MTSEIYTKPEISPNEDITFLFCINSNCGKMVMWPIDADYYPVFCGKRCRYDFTEGKNE